MDVVVGYSVQVFSFDVKKVKPIRHELVVVTTCFEKDK